QLLVDDRDRASGVDYVLDKEQMAAGERAFDQVREPHLPRCGRTRAVAGGPNELQLRRDAQASEEVGSEDRGALQDDDEDQRLIQVAVDLRDLLSQLAHAFGDAAGRDHRPTTAADWSVWLGEHPLHSVRSVYRRAKRGALP